MASVVGITEISKGSRWSTRGPEQANTADVMQEQEQEDPHKEIQYLHGGDKGKYVELKQCKM